MRTLLCLAVVTAATCPAVAADPPKPMNIVFCFADDWGRYAGAYAKLDRKPTANSVVKTPNIDGVANRGAMFQHAFVNSPSCTPCRSSLVSGRYFFNCGRGAILQGAVWDASIPTFPLMLKSAGYHIGKTTKVWSPGTPADAPFGGQAHSYGKAGGEFNNFSENVTAAVKNGSSIADARAKLIEQVRGNFDAFLADRPKDKPFLYWFGPTTVHRTWIKGSGKALWGIDPESLKGKLPANLPDAPEVREDFADYLGEIQAFDAYVGAILKRLDETGERDRTVVVISGDHGAPGFPGGKCNLYDFGTNVALIVDYPGSKAGRTIDDFVILMDLCPTFLEIGGVKAPPGLNSRSVVSLLKSEKSGQIDPDRGWVVTGRERHVGAAREGNLPYPHRALRTADYLYIRNFAPDRTPMGDPTGITADSMPSIADLTANTRVAFADMDAGPTKAWLVANRNDPKWKWHYNYAFGKRPAEELYDLKSDPEQVANVAQDAKFDGPRKAMAKQLMAILTEAGDPRVVEKECRFERSPFTDPENKGPGKKNPAKSKED